jgi:hypothetical protein
MYLDSFLKLADLEDKDMAPAIDALEDLSKRFGVDFILSISLDVEDLSENAKDKVTVSL